MSRRLMAGLAMFAMSMALVLPNVVTYSPAEAALDYTIVYSDEPEHANSPIPLDGATVSGTIYPYTTPDSGVERVEFSLDGTHVQTENNPPYDFQGGDATAADPWDTTTVSDGEHTIEARSVLTDGSTETVSATFTVDNSRDEPEPTATTTPEPTSTPDTSEYSLVYSTNADRSGADALDGATVSGLIYVFTYPDADVEQVAFSLDGAHYKTEGLSPYDFAGTGSSDAYSWDTSEVVDGEHTIGAEITLSDGSTESLSATFVVNNNGGSDPEPTPTATPEPTATPTPEPTTSPDPSTYAVVYSTSPDRSNPVALDGASVSGSIYAFTTPETDAEQVMFSLDGTHVQTEGLAPYDFAGTGDSDAYPWNTAEVSDGEHTIEAEISLTNGSTETVSATFIIDNGNGGSEPEPTPEPDPEPSPTSDPTLLRAYDTDKLAPGGYDEMRYQPRQFEDGAQVDGEIVDDAADYAGWDVLVTRHRLDTNLEIRLNRAATVGVVWMTVHASPPSWLDSWERDGEVTIDGDTWPVFRTVMSAGEHELGGYALGDAPYLVLLAEEDGSPSAPPAVPDGQVVPQPNQSCPAWVHDQYTTVGPDGNTYPTWHPQIDPVYWCYFGHDHGSNPDLFDPDIDPAFGYLANIHGLPENSLGFNVLVFEGDAGSKFMLMVHFTDNSLHRICRRVHTIHLWAKDGSGNVVANLTWKGDFGQNRSNVTNEPLTPTACAEEHADIESHSFRHVPIAPEKNNYEPWLLHQHDLVFQDDVKFVFNILDPQVICDDYDCDTPVPTDGSGTRQRFQAYNGDGHPFGIADQGLNGTFYTDPYGTELRDANDPDAVPQYIAPGTNVRATAAGYDDPDRIGCWRYDWPGDMFSCGTGENGGNGSVPAERENSISQ